MWRDIFHGNGGGEVGVDLPADKWRAWDEDDGWRPEDGGRELPFGLSLGLVAGSTGKETGRLCAAAESADGGELVGGKTDIFGSVLEHRSGGGGTSPEVERGKSNVGRRGGGLEGGFEGLSVGEQDGSGRRADGDGAEGRRMWRRGGRGREGDGIFEIGVLGIVVVVVRENEHFGGGRHSQLALQFAVLRFVSRAYPVRDPSLIFSASSRFPNKTRELSTLFGTAQHCRSFSTPLPPAAAATRRPLTRPSGCVPSHHFPHLTICTEATLIPSSTSHVLSPTPLSTLLSLIRRAFVPRRTTRCPALGTLLLVTNTPLRQSAPSSITQYSTSQLS